MDFQLLGQGLAIQQIRSLEPRRLILNGLQTLDSLRSPFLDNQPAFIELKGYLELFYKEKEEGTQITKWKEVLYTSLHSLLTEAVYTTDKSLQLKLLSKVSKWFYSKVNPAKPTSLYPAKPSSTDPSHKTRHPTISMRSTATETFSKSKPITPTPRIQNLNNTLKPSYQAFVNPIPPPDPELDEKLNKYFESLQSRQVQRLKLGKYQERRIQEWSELKSHRLESLNLKREVGSFSFSIDTSSKMNSTLYDFSKDQQPEKSFDTEESEEKYSLFSRPGILRKLKQRIIDIEEFPKKREIKHKEAIDDFPRFVSPGTSPGMGREQMDELFSLKSKLARKGIKSNLRELELGIIDAETKVKEGRSYPSGGEGLLINPFIQLEKKKKKKSKKKSKKG